MSKILAISGSLRAESYNTALLRTMKTMAPSHWEVALVVPKAFPVYDEDLQKQGWPSPVTELAQSIREADGVVISTPEYNYSIPGGLKNVIDWLSRLPDPPFKGKQVGIMGVSAGRLGAIRGQLHLRQCFQFLESHVLSRPEVIVGNAAQAFENGTLNDSASVEAMRAFIAALDACIEAISTQVP